MRFKCINSSKTAAYFGLGLFLFTLHSYFVRAISCSLVQISTVHVKLHIEMFGVCLNESSEKSDEHKASYSRSFYWHLSVDSHWFTVKHCPFQYGGRVNVSQGRVTYFLHREELPNRVVQGWRNFVTPKTGNELPF